MQPGSLCNQGAHGVADAGGVAGDAERAGLGQRLEDRDVIDDGERGDGLVETLDVRRDRRVALGRLGDRVAAG